MGGTSRRPQSAQSDRPRFTIGSKGAYQWAEIRNESKSRLHTKRAQEDDAEENVFTYRAALGGFGVKPEALDAGSVFLGGGEGDSDEEDAVSDAGSIFSEEEGKRRYDLSSVKF